MVDGASRLLLIGQAPARTGDPSAVLMGRTGLWLADLMGVPLSRYLEETDRVNLFDEWTGKNGKGDVWDVKRARELAAEMRFELIGRRVLFVGRSVATAFGMRRLPWLRWGTIIYVGAAVAVIPHPSGIVRWWNDEENRSAAAAFLREAVIGSVLEGAGV